MIRQDRLLLADLGQLNTDVAPLALRIMDQSATAEEQYAFADRLAAMALRLQERGARVGLVVDGDVVPTANGDVSPVQHQGR
ncbi:MAG: hypothetical protein ACRDSP_06855 [Pseudonocardiaceae bacterium]